MEFNISKIGLAVVIAVTLLAVGLFGYLVPRFGGPKARLSEPYEVTATFQDALGLEKSGDVWVRGVPVGKVESIDTEGDLTTAKLSIKDEYKPLHADATVRIGQKTPLGESFVDLLPGTPAAAPLQAGAAIRRVLPTVTTDQALRALDARARASINGLTAHLQAGARAEDAQAQVHGTLSGTAATIHQLKAISTTLRDQDTDVAALVRDGSTAVDAIGARERSLARIVDGGSRTLEAVGAQRPALEQIFRRLPALLTTTRRALDVVHPLLHEARPAMRDLRAASRALTPSFERLQPIARDASATLTRLSAFNAAALPVLSRAIPLVKTASPTVEAAAKALNEIQPMVAYLEPRRQSLAGFFSNMRAAVSAGDAKGTWYRFNIFAEPETDLGIPGAVKRNAYTRPGDAMNNQPYRSGDFPRLMPYAPR